VVNYFSPQAPIQNFSVSNKLTINFEALTSITFAATFTNKMKGRNNNDSSRGSNRGSKGKTPSRSTGRPRTEKPSRPEGAAGSRPTRGPGRPKGLRMGTSNIDGDRLDKSEKSFRSEKPRFEKSAGNRPDEKRPSSYDKKPRSTGRENSYNDGDRSSRPEKPFRERDNDKKPRFEKGGRSESEPRRFSREDLKPRSSREDGPFSKERPTNERKKRNPGGKGPGSFGSKPSAPRKFDAKKGGKDDGGFVKKNFLKPKGRNAEDLYSTGGEIRLNRFLSISGISSRREADDLIKMGLVTVNGKVITEMGYKVRTSDEVKYNGTKIRAEKKVYVLLNKPKGYITTVEDPKARKTVMDLIGGQVKERVYPVGRLDRSTMGVLLFTNDGDMAKKLTHPANGASKIYMVTLDKPVTKGDLDKIKNGLELEDGIAPVDNISYIEGKGKNNIGIEIHIGRNRIVRRIFESLGYEVTKLDRTSIAGLTKKNLSRGQWRYLTDKEVNFLKML